ncbi:MAG TPA: DUF2092 domain-containing protein [Caulobacteraceae bacterium]|jgi:hypothetical protein
MSRNPLRATVGVTLAALLVMAGNAAFSQATAQSPSAAIDPKAVAILKASCAALSGAKTLSFTAVDTYQRAARNGQPLYYTVKSDVTLQRPNKLRVIKTGDGVPDEFYYDGKTVMAYVPSQDLVAVADAPPTIDEMLASAWDRAEIHFPFADVIVSDPCDIYDEGLKSAFYVGQSKVVGGVPTDVIAITLEHAQGQLWIGIDDHLPRMIRTNYPNEPSRANYETDYSNWSLGSPVDASTFASDKAAAAKRMAFQPPSAAGDRAAPVAAADTRSKQGGPP